MIENCVTFQATVKHDDGDIMNVQIGVGEYPLDDDHVFFWLSVEQVKKLLSSPSNEHKIEFFTVLDFDKEPLVRYMETYNERESIIEVLDSVEKSATLCSLSVAFFGGSCEYLGIHELDDEDCRCFKTQFHEFMDDMELEDMLSSAALSFEIDYLREVVSQFWTLPQ